jgi:hypothetical protein
MSLGEHALRSILTFLSHGRDVDEDLTMVAWKQHSSHPGSNSGGPEWEHNFSAGKIPLTTRHLASVAGREINSHISTYMIRALMGLFCHSSSPAVPSYYVLLVVTCSTNPTQIVQLESSQLGIPSNHLGNL